MSLADPRVVLVSARSGGGKTRFCARWVERARARGASVAGLLSPRADHENVRANGQPAGWPVANIQAIDVVDLSSGERRGLARPRTDGPAAPDAPKLLTPRWAIDPCAIAWADARLRSLVACDLLVIDELGPLELEKGQGWQRALDFLDVARDSPRQACFRLALVSVRPALLPVAAARWPSAGVIRLRAPEAARGSL